MLHTIPFPVQSNIPLSTRCTLGVGGEAQYIAHIDSIEAMQQALAFCKQVGLRYLVLGNGSNCLFDDRGFYGMVLINAISFFIEQQGLVTVGGGYNLTRLGKQTARASWGGLEFGAGIPATVGGALWMNAGANGQQISDSLVKVGVVDEEGNIVEYTKQELSFGYRYSSFQERGGAIVYAQFQLYHHPQAEEFQKRILQARVKSQPYGARSAGCVFKNCEVSAGALIEACGLKGYRIGGAVVSTKHANFILNEDKASAQDIMLLIAHIKETVWKEKKILLQEEIQRIPYE